jgi:photosystem II stability/assembly factor-like uncharacterized protein
MAEVGEDQYKFNWNTPILISPHDRKTIYYAAEKVFRSEDRGDNWEAISPDLTRKIDRNALKVMDRVWSVDAIAKNASTSLYGSIIAFSESPLEKGLLYAGTDDGVIAVSEDDGENWRKTTDFTGVPDMALVEDIITSVHDADTAYAVFDNHKKGDFAPYVYKTTDRGETWVEIGADLPERGTAHTIAEDHEDPDLLFVGTEFGAFFTRDGGESWDELTGGLPTIAVRDLEIQRREDDLVIATFGRGIFILDDYSPLRASDDTLDEEAALFEVRDPWLYVEGDLWGPAGGPKSFQGDAFYHAENPAFGAVFTYHLKEGFETLRDARLKEEAEKQKTGDDTPYPSWDDLKAEDRETAPKLFAVVKDQDGEIVQRIAAPHTKGLHRTSWNLRHDAPDPVSLAPQEPELFGGPAGGPLVKPGRYSVELVVRENGEDRVLTDAQSFEVKPLERSPEAAKNRDALAADHLALRELAVASSSAGEKLGELNDRVAYLEGALDRTPEAKAKHYRALKEARSLLADTREALYGERTKGSRNEPAPMGMASRVGTLQSSVWGSQAPVGGAHKEQMAMAEREYASIRKDLTEAEDMLDGLEDELTELGAPWTPGRDLPTAP